jgi:glucose/arabinose dehydrogenase
MNGPILLPHRLSYRALLFIASIAFCAACAEDRTRIETIHLPDGFSIEVLVDNVPNARAMVFGDGGTLFVGSRDAGKLYSVEYRDRKRPRVRTLLEKLERPTGIAFRDGALYVAEVHRVLRFDDIEQRLVRLPEPVVVAELPTDAKHGWRYIAFGPDDRLYVAIGARCNVCEEEEGYGVIVRMNPDGSGRETFARGIRNSVGFTWHPSTGALVFTDNGRDRLGNDVPLCELNMATKAGQHFGFPYCHSGTISDPEFGHQGSCDEAVPPLQNLGPHVAPLGVKFYTGRQFPKEYRGDIFIAEHGSWNRDEPIGYRLTRIRLDGEKAISYEVFVDGWLQVGLAWGRPVDILLEDDGSMLVSDDLAGAIYRIKYNGTR